MQIQSTADISLDKLKLQAVQLPDGWHVEVDDAQMFFRSMDVPSWVSVVAEAPWWVQFLAASASVYVSGIISETGKDTWKNRGKIAAALRTAPSAIGKLAEFIVAAQGAGNPRTFVTLGIPFPDEHNTTHLKLNYTSPVELEFEIALFVHYVPAIKALWEREGLHECHPVGGILLEFGTDDCSLLVAWLDRKSLERKERVLSIGEDI
jgi:hypothetical protein